MTKRKASGKLAAPAVRPSAKAPVKQAVDEFYTAVANTDVQPTTEIETIELSSDPDSDEDLSDLEDAPATELANGKDAAAKTAQINGNGEQLPSPNNSDEGSDADEDGTSPTFGELLRSNDAIDVNAVLQQSSASTNAVIPRKNLQPPSHQSLSTVLSQALRTDDTDLLESCLQVTDLPTIHRTIEKMDSALAGTLLNKLAARLYRRPGRAGSLTIWVQWTIIAHSGALSTQTHSLQSMKSLQKVLQERSNGMNSLLALKGRLDLLEGQMKLRRTMQKQLSSAEGDDEDEEGLIYVEGETDEPSLLSRRKRAAEGDDSDDDEDLVNGVLGDTSDEDDGEDDDEEDEESDDGAEMLDEDDVDHEDVDESMGEEDDSDVETAPPAKMQKVGKAFVKRK